MSQVSISLNGRSYRLACGAGEETRLQMLAAHVKSKVDELSSQFGQAGEERLFLMAALLITDELFEVRDRLAQATEAAPGGRTMAAEAAKPAEPRNA